MRKRSKRMVLLVAFAMAVSVITAGAALAGNHWKHRKLHFTVEVAEDSSRFVFAGNHVIPDGELAGFPAYGDSFVTQGWIYPAGTLASGDDGITCETDADGVPTSCEPDYPDRVIGEWTCYGVHVGEGAATETGAWVVTTQIFNFGSPYGELTIVTDGFETPEDVEMRRAITGGTGPWKRAGGEHIQVFNGLGEDYFNVLTTNTFKVRR